MSKTLIIIPAYNEEDNIENVILSLKSANKNIDCIVINDASTDNTQKVAEATQSAYVIQLPANLGIGGAVQTGFKFAFENNYDYAIQFDGDGQHLATEIPKILIPVMNNECDACIGSRFLNDDGNFKSTFSRRLGIRFFKYLNTLLVQQKITDSTSGFRAYNKATIAFLAKYYPTDYPEPETIVLLGKNQFVMKEVPVLMQERQGGHSSISGLKSIYYMIKVSLAMLMTATRKKIRR